MRRDLPSGTVTLVFTDIEGSTKLLNELGAQAYADAQGEHRRLLRNAFTRRGGVEVDTQGDAFFYAFPSAPDAVRAAGEGRDALESGPIRVRMGIHTGTPHLTDEGYVGRDVNLGARIGAAGHGGQVLLSKAAREFADADVVDLGEHRLKDFDEPVWIFQLGAERHPPLRTISNTNLPHPASSFVGREVELSDTVAQLRSGARLLTLTGPGGSGKTRLAIEAAVELVPEFRNGVFWIGLATLRDPALVADTIAQTLGAKEGLADYVGDKEMLLLLDNFEQVVDAAPVLSSLVEGCPNLRLLVTSRELLRVQGEVEYPVPALAKPEAVELFCARSRLEADETIGELCRRLDNLPLAVELAAARSSVLSPTQILERVSQRLDLFKGGRDADPRQATLRATIEWSYELLTHREQRLFGRLVVFAGCTLASAEEVAEADLDTLQSIVDKSLVRHTDERFWMLETIREYATERLEDSGEAERMKRRHARHYLAYAEKAEPYVKEDGIRGSGEWLDGLDRELDNFRAALDWLEASGETHDVLRLAGGLSAFWASRGHVAEGRRRLEGALRADERPTPARAKALNGAAELAGISGDSTTMGIWAEQALAIHRTLTNPRGEAESLQQLGYAVGETGDWARAQHLLEESVRLFRAAGEEHWAGWTTRTLAWIYAEAGDKDRARALHEDNLARARALDNPSLEAALLSSLAWLLVGDGRHQDSFPLLKHSLRIRREMGNRIEIAMGLCSVARAITAVGKTGTAARLISCFEAMTEDIGGGEAWVRRMNEETLATIREQFDETALAEAWEQGRTLTLDEAAALALESLNEVAPANVEPDGKRG